MKIINHGVWRRYEPPEKGRPEGMPLGMSMMFCKNSKGEDWYEYQKKLRPDTIKMTVDLDYNNVVQAVSRDASMLFPQNSILLEIEGDDEKDPQKKYGQQIYHAKTNSINPPAPPTDTLEPIIGQTYALVPDGALAKLRAVKPVSFRYREPYDDGKRRLGFMGYNLKEAVPNAVEVDKSGGLATLDTTQLLSLLVKAIQELAEKLDAQGR